MPVTVYKVVEKIGEGGMGVVYRAHQTNLERDVALKLLLDAASARPHDLARFAREVRAIARVNHPNVIRILDYGTISGQPFYAMDYLATARTLGQVMRDGPLSIDRTVAVLRQLLDALAAVHRAGLIHRDIKPGNVMIDGEDAVTLMDFGLVKDLDAESMTRTGVMIGTPRYLSPEAVQAEPIDARSDLFSLGVMMHEALTGRRLFNGDTITALAVQIVQAPTPPLRSDRRDCPEWLADLIVKMLEKDPARRPASALAALNELRRRLGEPELEQVEQVVPSGAASVPGDVLPESTILGGLAALCADIVPDGSPTPPPASTPGRKADADSTPPASKPGRSAGPDSTPGRPRGARKTGSHAPLSAGQHAARPGNARLIALAAGTAGLVFALTVFALWPRGESPRVDAPGPSTTAPASPAPSSLATPRPAAADRAIGQALAKAISELAPATRIRELHTQLQSMSGTWFREPATPGMVAFREAAGADLARRVAAARLLDLLARFRVDRCAYFTDAAIPPVERLDAYVGLQRLLDLELYCDRFHIAFAPVTNSALCDRFGQQTRGQLVVEPAWGYALADDVSGDSFHVPSDDQRASWHIAPVNHATRFYGAGDAEISDILRTLGEGQGINLVLDPQQKVIPSLDGVTALEVSGWSRGMAPNCSFEIQLSDGSGWRTVTVVRDLDGNQPQRWWGTVDRALFPGKTLALRVLYHILPDMNTGREFAYLFQVQVHARSGPGK